MSTNQKPLFIAFSTQKGGVGKSTFTALVASLLHYRSSLTVAVFDCDFPQYSLTQMRERDLRAVMENEALKRLAHRQFTTINKKAYTILQCKADTFWQQADDYLKKQAVAVDIVLVDLPGTVNSSGVLTILAGMHHIFSPITADRIVLESTLSFTDVLYNVLLRQGHTSIKTISLFWNQVDGREKSDLYHAYEKIITELGLSLMDSYITDSKRFRKEGDALRKTVFRSTVLPADEKLMKSCKLDVFMEEFLTIISR